MLGASLLPLPADGFGSADRNCASAAASEVRREAKSAARFFTPAQHTLVEELSETIIPADSHSGGAKAAKVADYIEQVLRESADDNQKSTWREGLRLVDLMSQHYNGKSFVDSSSEERIAVLTVLSDNDHMTDLPGSPILSRAETPYRPRLLHLQDRHSRRAGIQGQSDSAGICRLRRSCAKVISNRVQT